MTWPPSIAALERRAPWGSGASAMAHMMKPQIILLKARSSRDLHRHGRSNSVSMNIWKQRISNEFTNDLWWFHDLNCDPGRNRCLTRKGPDHQQYQRLPSRSELRLLHFSCCTMLIMLHLYDLCLSLNCGRPLPRLWASWSPLWDLVVWTSW